jgi:ribosomal-protein-alanine N-acetyltransferase
MSLGPWDIRVGDRELSPSFIDDLRQFAQDWQTGDEHFWSCEEIVASLARPEVRAYYVVEHRAQGAAVTAPKWQGFLLAEIGPYSTELLYVHVERHGRRSGLGRALLSRLIADLKTVPTQEALFLEVRAGNTAAQGLYRDLGMVEVGRRPRYYANGDDALVFKLDLHARPG